MHGLFHVLLCGGASAADGVSLCHKAEDVGFCYQHEREEKEHGKVEMPLYPCFPIQESEVIACF